MAQLKVAGGNKGNTTLTKKGKFFDYTLLIVVMFLIAFGLIMAYSAGSYSGIVSKGNNPAYYFQSQLKAVCVGIVVMLLVVFINNKVWYVLSPFIYIASLVIILLVLTPLGKEINGARRWIGIGGFSLQVAEVAKVGLIITLASFISYSGSKMKNMRNCLVVFGLTGIVSAMILLITNNLSTAIIIFGMGYIMLVIANPKPQWILIITGILIALVIAFLIIFFNVVDDASDFGFRFQRLLAWRNPEKYASGVGYQTIQALYAIGSGGFFGKGLGNSIQKLGFIPEAQNDMVFSIICEELGLFGAIAVILLFVVLMWRLVIIANNAPDLYSFMLVVGVMAHIAIQLILNIAVVTNSIPNTGVTLPFISSGGSSVMFLMIEIGIVLNVSMQIRVPVAVGKE